MNTSFDNVTHAATYRLVESLLAGGRIGRELFLNDELIASEKHPFGTEKGTLAEVTKQLDEFCGFRSSDKCDGCRYKVGDYRGDPSYLLYVIFRTRIRLQLFKLKFRLLQFAQKYFGLKRKTTRV